jgi:hypothetical protein
MTATITLTHAPEVRSERRSSGMAVTIKLARVPEVRAQTRGLRVVERWKL